MTVRPEAESFSLTQLDKVSEIYETSCPRCKYVLVQKVCTRGRGDDVLTSVMMFFAVETVRLAVAGKKRLGIAADLSLLTCFTLSVHSHLCVLVRTTPAEL